MKEDKAQKAQAKIIGNDGLDFQDFYEASEEDAREAEEEICDQFADR
jgi:hypothetical protein